MEYNELVQGFASKAGVAGLEIQDGATALEMDDMTVGFVHDEESDSIMVVVEIGSPPPDADGPFGSMMLKANYLFGGTGGAVICQNPDTGAYAVMRGYQLVTLDVETFSTAVEELLNTAERWKRMISAANDAEDAKESLDEEEEGLQPSSGFPMGGFMQVLPPHGVLRSGGSGGNLSPAWEPGPERRRPQAVRKLPSSPLAAA